jgi:hypothetical protein
MRALTIEELMLLSLEMHVTLDEALDMSAELNIADRELRIAALH